MPRALLTLGLPLLALLCAAVARAQEPVFNDEGCHAHAAGLSDSERPGREI